MRVFKTILWFAPVALLAAGCATIPPEEDPVLLKLTELEDRLRRVERVVNNDSLLDLNAQVVQLRDEVNQLRGTVETTQFELEGLANRNREQYLDLDGRIVALEKGGIISNGGSGDGALGNDPADVYKQAFDLLKERRYDEAQSAFGEFVTRFPDNALVDNAQYWLGETSYVKGDYAVAQSQFQKLVDTYPNSSKMSDALLKIGFSQFEQGDMQAARSSLERVVAEYPDETASRLATQQLEKMGR